MTQSDGGVPYAVEQVCQLYGVQYTREQSRQFNVQGAAGRWRPMFFGSWVDDLGKRHNAGKPDFLLRPRISFHLRDGVVKAPVPFWVECKSADGKVRPDQWAFKAWIEKNGDYYMLLREDVRPLIAWFDEHGVTKNCDETALATVVSPLDASELYKLLCKHCGFARDKHVGAAFACPLHLKSSPKLMGKVWSPDLRKGVK